MTGLSRERITETIDFSALQRIKKIEKKFEK